MGSDVSSIPFVDLAAQHREIAEEVQAGFAEVMATTSFVQGKAVAAFEQEYADYIGVSHCVAVGNGTDALEIALRAAGVGRDDEVVVPANTFVATAEAVARIGARTVLVDVHPDTLLMAPELLADAIGPRTRAVVPVHLYGQTADMESIRAVLDGSDIVVVEDAAQSQGARRHGRSAGSFGIAAGTSFYPGKNLGAYGDAGAVLTDSADVARTARLIANHGSERRYEHEVLGFNSRLDTFQGVVLRAKLARLEAWNQARRDAADRYDSLLEGVDGVTRPTTADGNEHVWHLYVVQVDDRDRVLAHLGADGVGAGVHYPIPVHLHPAFEDLRKGPGSYPVSEAAASRILSLSMHPHLTPQQQERVVSTLVTALG